MDPELKAYLDGMREGLERQIGSVQQNIDGVRQDVDTVREGLERQIGSVQQNIDGVRQDMDTVREGLERQIGSVRQDMDTIRKDFTKQIAESRKHTETSNAETRGEITDRMFAMNTETRRLVADQVSIQINETRRDLTARMVTLNVETRAHAEHLHAQAIEHTDRLHVEARVLIEKVAKAVGLVWEGVQGVRETIDHVLEDHEQRIQRLEHEAL